MNLKERIEKFTKYVTKNRDDFNKTDRTRYTTEFLNEAEKVLTNIEEGLEIIKQQQEIIESAIKLLRHIQDLNSANISEGGKYLSDKINAFFKKQMEEENDK